jgi:hypothetical protein
MPNVAFVMPYGLEASLRFAKSAVSLPDVRLGIISQEPAARLPEDLRRKLVAHEVIGDATNADQLEAGVRALARGFGGWLDRLFGVLEQLQEPMAEVRERLRIRGMDLAEAMNFRDKSRMKDVLASHGLSCARHKLCGTREEALAFAREVLPLVVKPPAGAGAKNTFRVETVAELESYLKSEPLRRDRPLLLEELIFGREHSFDSVTVHGKHVFHSISRYFPGPLEVMENAWIQWCVILPRAIDVPEFDDIRVAGRRALDALGMVTGLTHMEWFRREDGSIAISEVAARPPGAQFTSLLSLAHDHDFYRAWAELMIFDTFSVPERRFSAGAVYLRGQGQGRVKAVHGFERAEKELGDLIVASKLPQPGTPQASSYEGEGFIIVRHPETEAVEAGCKRLLELVKIEMG